MSDRNVRNPADALAQRLAKTEERVRALSLRAWPGAVRTAMMESVTIEEPLTEYVPEAWVPIVPLGLTAGRWVIIGHTRFEINPMTMTHYNLQVRVEAALDDGTVVSEGNSDYDFHTRVEYQNGLTAGIAIYRTMETIGHFVSEDPVTVTMLVNNYAGDIFVVTGTCLLAIPV